MQIESWMEPQSHIFEIGLSQQNREEQAALSASFELSSSLTRDFSPAFFTVLLGSLSEQTLEDSTFLSCEQ
jgi:hypothetical protein